MAPAAVQGKSEQRPHKLSFHVSAKGSAAEQLVEQLEQKIQAAGGRCLDSMWQGLAAPRHVDAAKGAGCTCLHAVFVRTG